MAKTKGKAKVQKKAEALEVLRVDYVPVSQISPNSYNPNRQSEHDFELLKRSMDEDGFTQPAIVVREDGSTVVTEEVLRAYIQTGGLFTIVDGEHRWRAAHELGKEEIPVTVVPMTPEQAKIATLRHNRARGSEDVELTGALLRDLRELGALDWAQDSLLLDDVEVDALMEDTTAAEALAGEEYGEAWEPADEQQDHKAEEGHKDVSMTPEAVTAVREREQAVAQASTDEERRKARQDASVYRISLVFAGDEGAIIREVLGDTPAAGILEMCKERYVKDREGRA